MLLNLGPSQESSKEEYKSWKWGATARYYAFHTKTMSPTGSLCQDPAGNQTTQRPPDHRKEAQTAVVSSCLLFIMSGQNHLKAQWKGEEDRADRGRDGKTTWRNGQAWSSPSPRGQWRTGKNRENWLWNHMQCPNNPHNEGIDNDELRWDGVLG